jgi:hypothetical protein
MYRTTSLNAAMLLAMLRLWGRWLIAERRRATRYRPVHLSGTMTHVPIYAPGRATVTYSTRLTDRPSLAETIASWWTVDAAA